MALRERQIQHLLRRAGLGATPLEVETYSELGIAAAIDRLVIYESLPDTSLQNMNAPGFARVSSPFTPNTNIDHARQRWIYRMVYSPHPLREKMTIFLHDLFATSYTKLSGLYGGEVATRMMAAIPSEDLGGMRGQIELLRDNALGSFRDLLIQIAQDPAMLVWLDGETNKKGKPQENFSREVMELFSIGRDQHTENDVLEGARVFTGWNMRRIGASTDPSRRYEFFYDATQHDTGAKTFSFPIYPDGASTIPTRTADQGYQDGVDLLTALARHPATGRRLATLLWSFFISEQVAAPTAFVNRLAEAYQQSGFNLRVVMLRLLSSPEFWDPSNHFARYSWPVEFTVRALKEVGCANFSLSGVPGAMTNMGQALYAPPSVGGWNAGQGWFSTGALIARMNFASSLTGAMKSTLATENAPHASTPQRLLARCLNRLSPADFEPQSLNELSNYLGTGVTWSGASSELGNKVAGVTHLILGSAEYQLV